MAAGDRSVMMRAQRGRARGEAVQAGGQRGRGRARLPAGGAIAHGARKHLALVSLWPVLHNKKVFARGRVWLRLDAMPMPMRRRPRPRRIRCEERERGRESEEGAAIHQSARVATATALRAGGGDETQSRREGREVCDLLVVL